MCFAQRKNPNAQNYTNEGDSGINTIPLLSNDANLNRQLADIQPSHDGGVYYYPCQVELKNGSILENVYFVETQGYLRHWGVLPGDDKNKQALSINDITVIKESPNRLPAHLANKLYKAGESGMGYCLFKIIYDNGTELDVLAGNAVDFVPSPDGLNTTNIIDVLPHHGSREIFARTPKYYWCLYEA